MLTHHFIRGNKLTASNNAGLKSDGITEYKAAQRHGGVTF